jgi:hypothetical protein
LRKRRVDSGGKIAELIACCEQYGILKKESDFSSSRAGGFRSTATHIHTVSSCFP